MKKHLYGIKQLIKPLAGNTQRIYRVNEVEPSLVVSNLLYGIIFSFFGVDSNWKYLNFHKNRKNYHENIKKYYKIIKVS